jgi:hypothetical protein
MNARVLLGIPSGGSVKTKTMMSIIQVLFQTQAEITLVEREGALGPDNRNHLAQMALDGDYTHLFLVDADMSFPGDTLERLLAHKKDLIGASYNYRAFPRKTVVKLLDSQGGMYAPPSELHAREVFKCYAIGSGLKLVSTQALAHIPRPWFALDFDKDGMLSVSDDVWFCQQARRVGIDTWCDPTIKAGHIGECEF